MKKIFIALTILVFSINANAQAKKPVIIKSATSNATPVATKATNEAKAEKNVADLKAFMPLTEIMASNMLGLFKTKYKMLDEAGATIERRQIVNQIIERKLEATLDGASFDKLKANTSLFKSLVD